MIRWSFAKRWIQWLIDAIRELHDRAVGRDWCEFWGVDFSGAEQAGKAIWVAKGRSRGSSLQLVSLSALEERNREGALAELRNAIRRAGHVLVGLDFPFGLPRSLMAQEKWMGFVAAFGIEYGSPEKFRGVMRSKAQGKELRRKTDVKAKTPMSPYNLRLYKQTFYGIRDVLAPLVAADEARVLPMQRPTTSRPALIEICPRSTLKATGLANGSVAEVLAWLAAEGVLIPPDIARRVLVGPRDALDGVIAMFATWRSAATKAVESPRDCNAVEGYVFTGGERTDSARFGPVSGGERIIRVGVAAAILALLMLSLAQFAVGG